MTASPQSPPALQSSTVRPGNAAMFASGAALTAVLSLATQLLMERGLGPSGFARWALCSALVTLFGTLATFGLNSLLMADHYRRRLVSAQGRHAVRRYALVCTCLASMGLVAVYAGAPFRVDRTWLEIAMAAVLVLLMLPVTAAYAVYQICGYGLEIAYWPVLQNLARFAAALVALCVAIEATQAIAIWLGCVVLLALWAVRSLARAPAVLAAGPQKTATGHADPDANLPALPSVDGAHVGRRARRFGWVELLDSIDLKVALPISALFLPELQVAAVGLGLLLVNAIHYFPYVFVMRYLLPAVHRADAAGGGGLPRLMGRYSRAGLLASAATGTAVAMVAPAAIAMVATGDYGAERGMFVAAGLATVPLVMSILCSGAFLGESHVGTLLRLRGQATAVFLLCLVILVPQLGAAAPFAALAAGRAWLWWALWRLTRRLTSRIEKALG